MTNPRGPSDDHEPSVETTRYEPAASASAANGGQRRRGRTVAGVVVLLAALGVALGGSLVGRPPQASGPPATGAIGDASSHAAGSPTPAIATASPTATGSPSTEPAASPSPSAGPTIAVERGYLVTRAELLQRADLARQGVQPYRAAVADLLDWAKRAVKDDPKPAKRLRIKGTEGPFVDDTATAYGLALAAVVSGDTRYAAASKRFIMAWVDTTTSTRGTCPNDGACQTSLIISRTVPGFVFAADLLAGPGGLTPSEDERFRTWLRRIMLPTASELGNNWGDAGTFTRVVLTDYLGDRAGFEAAIAKWHTLLDEVRRDGHIPAEVARQRAGLSYTQEALDYKVAVAVIAERRGVDLWSAEGARGGTLKRAVDYLARYMHDPAGWPWHDGVRRRAPSPFWELAFAHWRDRDYVRLVEERRPQGVLGHSAIRWTTLTNGIPTRG